MLILILLSLLFKMFGMGLLGSQLLVRVSGEPQDGSQWALYITAHGLLLQYLLFLGGLNLEQVSMASFGLATLGWLSLYRWRPKRWREGSRTSLYGVVIAILFLIKFLSTPNEGHDARLIWFAHAKFITQLGSLWIPDIWRAPELFFSHTDYPLLISTLAAHVSYVTGVWNEYLPRFALLFAILPCIFGFLSGYRRGWLFAVFMLMCFVKLDFWLWHGLQDGFLALMAGVAVMMLLRFRRNGHRADFYSAVLSLALVSCFKNEGMLFALITLFCFAIDFIWHRNLWPKLRWIDLAVAGLYALPMLIWQFLRQHWGILNDLNIGENISRMGRQRITSAESLRNILTHMLGDSYIGRFVIVVAVFAWFWRKTRAREVGAVLLTLAIATLYWLCLFSIYIITPLDLEFHLVTSVDRTTMPVVVLLCFALYLMANQMEARGDAHQN
jgi:hypothetical protein